MPEQYTLQEQPRQPIEVPKNNSKRLLVGGGVGLGLALIFIIGLLLGKGTSSKTLPIASMPTPTTQPVTSPVITPITSTAPDIPIATFLPNKQYFDDTYVVISQDKPHETIVLSTSRIEQQRHFVEYTKVNYFDGVKWERKSVASITTSSSISTNPILRTWAPAITTKTTTQPLATVNLPNKTLIFSSSNLTNEISIQSQPGSTKFIYQGKGSVTINGESHPAYVFYSRSYSFNAVDLSYLTKPDKVTSNWFLFWDKEGSFYYLDDHKGNKEGDGIPTFMIAVRGDSNNAVFRTSTQATEIVSENAVQTYTADITFQREEKLFLPLTNANNKSDKKTYNWITASGEGVTIKAEGRKVAGLGFVEYLRQN